MQCVVRFQREGCILNSAFKNVETNCKCSPIHLTSDTSKIVLKNKKMQFDDFCQGKELGCSLRAQRQVFQNKTQWGIKLIDSDKVNSSSRDKCEYEMTECKHFSN